MDWNKLAGPAPWYGVAVNNAKNVGARTGDLLLFMMDNFGLSASDVHVIGWSLGGQLVAFIGQQTNGKLKTNPGPASHLFLSSFSKTNREAIIAKAEEVTNRQTCLPLPHLGIAMALPWPCIVLILL